LGVAVGVAADLVAISFSYTVDFRFKF